MAKGIEIYFNPAQTKLYPQLYEYIATKKSLLQYISYIINSNTRKAVFIPRWIKEQVDNPDATLFNIAQNIPDGKTTDQTMYNVFKYVKDHFIWTREGVVWSAAEYWATANELMTRFKDEAFFRDDCDGGATFMYVLARLKGIPANRLLIFAGLVGANEGHCWLGYRSDEYPLNWCFMDWCYNPSLLSMSSRYKYYIKDQTIYAADETYHSIWFGFNEDASYYGLMNTV